MKAVIVEKDDEINLHLHGKFTQYCFRHTILAAALKPLLLL